MSVEIQDVSDTALWVAYYRAQENERSDALFRDPYAKLLIGDRGREIAESMKEIGRYTAWSVVSRTVIIDEFIRLLIAEGIDTVLNLGAGLDTRPYRMDLPADLEWIEADFPKMIDRKNDLLKSAPLHCKLTRVGIDLADDARRSEFLHSVAPGAKKILVLTEGVIPYLSPEQVGKLADDLHGRPELAFWITEYFSPMAYRYLKRRLRKNQMRNAPFRFYPDDWCGFFAGHGWRKRVIRFSSDVAIEHGRMPPMPWFGRLFMIFAGHATKERIRTMSGYMMFERA